MRTTAVIKTVAFLVIFGSLDARRMKAGEGQSEINNGMDDQIVTCTAVGDSDTRAEGMSVTWGVPKKRCMEECGPTSSSNKGFTAERGFTAAFHVSFDKLCQCSSADGKQAVRFKPKNLEEAGKCKDGTSEEIHEVCWQLYLKARGTRYEKLGVMHSPRYTVPFHSGEFVVKKGCSTPCDGCEQMTIQSALHGMPRDQKVFLGQAIQKVMCGEDEDVSDALKEVIRILPLQDLDVAEYEAVDTNSDGKRSKEELHAFYKCTDFTKAQINKFIEVADVNKDDSVGLDDDDREFLAFKEEMRAFNPDVDLINGETEFVEGEDGQLHEVKATWTPMCIKNGREVDAAECAENSEYKTQDAALQMLKKGCE